jgi:hypothetical protein
VLLSTSLLTYLLIATDITVLTILLVQQAADKERRSAALAVKAQLDVDRTEGRVTLQEAVTLMGSVTLQVTVDSERSFHTVELSH